MQTGNETQPRVLVAPSILSADFANLAADCMRAVNAGAKLLHVDIMDGHFVPNLSIGVPVVKTLHAALPGVFLDVHLMLQNPLEYVGAFADAGAGLISFHFEASSPIAQTIDAIHAKGVKAGLVIKPDTPASAVFPYLKDVEMVLVMSIEPGFGGQKFMPMALGKISAIRDEAKRQGACELLLEVDGGINAATCEQVVNSGANVVVAGTAVFGAENLNEAFAALAAQPLAENALMVPSWL